jgi:hypothetical protein
MPPELETLELKVESLKELLLERDKRFEMEVQNLKEQYTAAFAATERAINKAEANTDKRFDSVTKESELRDQAARAGHNALRTDLTTVKDDLRKEVQDLRESRSETKGKTVGMDKSWAMLIAAIATVIGIMNFVTNHLR